MKLAYKKISDKLKVELHSFEGIDKFASQFVNGIKEFMNISREKAKEAQYREIRTIQPKEALSTLTKATLTIENYLGGKYFFTVDEIIIQEDKVFLIEAKHSKNSPLPRIGDIKDGFIKMILYTNLENVIIDGRNYITIPVLKLTSCKLKEEIISSNVKTNIQLKKRQKKILKDLFEEAEENNFKVLIEKVK